MPMSVAAAVAVSGGMNPPNTHPEFYKDHCNKYLNDSFLFPFFPERMARYICAKVFFDQVWFSFLLL